jgi:tRNA dimethylallyltransferase
MYQTALPGASGPLRNAVLIAGPTASGKSRMALDMAERLGGAIVNADSMQVYRQLRIVTARPTDEEMARAPHFLYGHVDASSPYSTGQWLADVASLMETLAGRPAIFVGGTGLYFKSLTEGISQMPAIPEPVRERWRSLLEESGAAALHGVLRRDDPDTASLLEPSDGQRIVRALEVLEASGRSIREWRKARTAPLVDAASASKIIIDPDRETLGGRIDHRFDAMVAQGALEEVRLLLALGLPPSMPAMKAIGVPELAGHLAGGRPLEDAVARARIATRQYAKRQRTWFRNQMDESWRRISGAE